MWSSWVQGLRSVRPPSPLGEPSFTFFQYLLSSVSVSPTSERSFKQTLNSFKLIFLKQKFDHIIRLLKKLCWFPFSYKGKSRWLTGIPLQPGLNPSTLCHFVHLWRCCPRSASGASATSAPSLCHSTPAPKSLLTFL